LGPCLLAEVNLGTYQGAILAELREVSCGIDDAGLLSRRGPLGGLGDKDVRQLTFSGAWACGVFGPAV
jgi:hypothetical protein